MEYFFESIVRLTMEHQKGSAKSRHISTEFFLECSPNLDDKQYIDKEDILTKEGSQALTNCLVQGLIGNIHFSKDQGYRNDVEHLKYIISELERGFAEIMIGERGEF